MTQSEALKIMKTGVNIYLTGSAGSGKTYLLNQYISYLQDHNIAVAVTASTGIAATHMNGMTIHGWSGIGIKDKMGERELDQLEEKKYLWKRFEKARVLIIDEISMLHGYQLDMVESICRKFKRNDNPFGGLQVILSGDFFQLPPVIKSNQENNEKSSMVYESEAWKILNGAICYLTEQHRQEDEKLTEILNMIRSNSIEEKHFEYLQKRINATLKGGVRPTKLYTHNINVDIENYRELALLPGEEQKYQMTTRGPDVLVDILKKSCLAYEELRLKAGAEIICIKNNIEGGYVNGTRGKVIGFDTSSYNPIIELYNGKKITITPMDWAIEEDGKIKTSLTQLPLRLAWAITIHKSQGMSLDNAEIDLRNTFTYGMGYVALSRVRTLEGIRLIGFSPKALEVNPLILELDQDLKNESTQNELLFSKLKKTEQEKLEIDFIDRMGGTREKEKNVKGKTLRKALPSAERIPTILITKELLENGMRIKEISKERNLTRGTITHHIEQIIKEFPKTDIKHIKPSQKNIELVKKVSRKLKGDEIGKLSPIKTILDKQGYHLSFEEIRLAKLFI